MKRKIKIQSISAWSIGIALILTVVFVVILHYGKNEVKRFEDATDQYIVCENAARQLQDGSDYLTEQVRLYAMTGERNYLDQYFEEADVTKRREQALESLKKYFDKTEAFQSLQQAMEDSKELMLTEYHSLKLVATVMGEKDIPAELEQLDLPEEEKQLSQKEKLEKAGVPDPLLDARFLLLDVFDMNFASFLVKRDRPLTETENGTNVTEADTDTRKKIDKYWEMISKREMRIPLQQLTGVQEFMGLEFYVNEHVLIPRQDTETLVELILNEHKEKNISLLDVCTGSGCIAVSLAKLGGYADVTALDLSEEALKVAKSNGEKLLDHPVKFIKSDMFSALDPENRYDVIVSNPPYIPSQVIEGLEPEVKDHEPRMALDGEPDGLKFYRILAEEGKKYLKNGGEIYMEIGWDQAKDVTEIFEAMGFSGLRTVRDMAGNDRVVCARKEK